MSDTISKAKFAKHVKSIVVPEGFTASTEVERWFGNAAYNPQTQVFVLKSDTIELRFDQTGGGHTLFTDGKGHKLCFDRRGVEDSFYHLPMWEGDDTVYDLNAIVAEQLERVAEYLKVADTFIQVPDLPFTVTPERLVELKKQLKTREQITFMPSGFGTGYIVSYGTKHRSGTKRATQATEKFFGVTPLYISTFDAD